MVQARHLQSETTSFGRAVTIRCACWMAVLVMAALLGLSAAQANERVISDDTFRLALFGYDPVSYFADNRAREGSPTYEVLYQRLVWRFANEGNMLAFEDDPDRFIPSYGGHGAYAVSQGAARSGHPEIWERLGGRVFLFHDEPARYAFLLEAQRLLHDADVQWPDIKQTLAP